MVFLDTCVWIEICGSTTPKTKSEKKRATKASMIFSTLLKEKKQIITCKEQLIEIITAIEKIKMKEYNRKCKTENFSGVGSIKDFRRRKDSFVDVQNLCKQVCGDVIHFSEIDNKFTYTLNDLLDNIHIADINDYMYFSYCKGKNIKLYTFDKDFSKLSSDNDTIVQVL